MWQGLGYYSRARNLHEAARSLAGRGRLPETYKEVRAMKEWAIIRQQLSAHLLMICLVPWSMETYTGAFALDGGG